MDIGTAVDYVRGHHRAVLSTVRRDGTPQMSPVAVAVDGEGRVIVSTRERSAKAKNVRRDPRAWVCVIPDGWYPQGDGPPFVQLALSVDVLSLPEAMEPLVDYYRAVAGEHPDWDDYREAMRGEGRCLLRGSVLSAGPDFAG